MRCFKDGHISMDMPTLIKKDNQQFSPFNAKVLAHKDFKTKGKYQTFISSLFNLDIA